MLDRVLGIKKVWVQMIMMKTMMKGLKKMKMYFLILRLWMVWKVQKNTKRTITLECTNSKLPMVEACSLSWSINASTTSNKSYLVKSIRLLLLSKAPLQFVEEYWWLKIVIYNSYVGLRSRKMTNNYQLKTKIIKAVKT